MQASQESNKLPQIKNWFHFDNLDIEDCSTDYIVVTPDDFQVQSEDVMDMVDSTMGDITTHETLTFVDDDKGLVYDKGYSNNPIAALEQSTGTDLAGFLSRPTLIDTRTWSTSDTVGLLGSEVTPWFAFLNNTVIKNKLQNYAFLRGKLCLKIVINATPFHFGLARVAYEPNASATFGPVRSKIRITAGNSLPLIVPYSQLPGTWLVPADNAGGEIHVPYFRATNWVAIAGSGSATDVKGMGYLKYIIASPLAVASATASSSLSIQTYAWMEDVQLMGSTAELTLQSQDEYDGVISKPASALASVSSKLESIPVIGKFARATTIGANALASVASIFGFTNVPVIEDVHAIMPGVAPHMASAQIGTALQKLAYDPKTELSIDPSLHGLGSEDELCIKSIIQRKSFLCMANWATTDLVGVVTFNCAVSPALFYTTVITKDAGGTAAYRTYHTPLSYVNQMFANWRGDMVFEIEVICTKFHKGRLKITWDPLGSTGTVDRSVNAVYSTILDIGETNKAVFTVPYHQQLSFLKTVTDPSNMNWSFGLANTPVDPGAHNGNLNISVLTPLMSPVTPQSVGIKVSVKAGDNLEFANPRTNFGSSIYSTPPSFFDVQARDDQDQMGDAITLGDSGSKHPHRYALNFGEQIVSLRTILHRYALSDTIPLTASSATACVGWYKSIGRNLTSFGYDPNGMTTAVKLKATTGNYNFNFDPTHPITYVSNMFGGIRGSLNVVFNPSSDLHPYIGDMRVERFGDSGLNNLRGGTNYWVYNSGDSLSVKLRNLNTYIPFTLNGGGAITNTQTNAGVSVNWPHMSGFNMIYPDPYTAGPTTGADGSDRDALLVSIFLKQSASAVPSNHSTISTYVGTGPDYTCLWWLCCPTVDYYITLPVAT